MRITIALGFFNPCPPVQGGGVERMWHQLAQEFARGGNDVTIVCRTWPGMSKRENVDNVHYLRLPGFAHRQNLIANLLLDLLWAIRVFFHLPKADVLITNSIVLPILSGFFRFCGITVVNMNRYPKGQQRCYGRVSRIEVPSHAIARAVSGQAPALSSRIRVVPNSVELSPLLQISRVADRTPLVVGFLGRLHSEKGIDLLLDAAMALSAMPGVPPWKIALTGPHAIGQGGGGEEYQARLKEKAASLIAQNRVEFLPATFNGEEIAARYSAMDIFCYPSLAEKGETFGIAVLEAMASALPVIVSNLECFTDLVTENREGLIFDHRSPDATGQLASCIAALLCDAEKRKSLGNAAREKSRLFDTKHIALQHLRDFQSLLQSAA